MAKKLEVDDLVSHKGKIYEVVGMIGPGLVKVISHGEAKVLRLNQVKVIEGRR